MEGALLSIFCCVLELGLVFQSFCNLEIIVLATVGFLKYLGHGYRPSQINKEFF